MKQRWVNLPNADHIDRILDSVDREPHAWLSDWTSDDTPLARAAAVEGTHHQDLSVRDAFRLVMDYIYDAVCAVWDDNGRTAYYLSRDAIMALIVWPQCASLLDMPPDVVRVLATLGDDTAILLLPVIHALSPSTELDRKYRL